MLDHLNNAIIKSHQLQHKLALMVLILICTVSTDDVVAQNLRTLSMETARDYDFGVWADAGSVSSNQTLCAVAWDSNRSSAKRYSTLVRNTLGSSGYYIYLDGDSSATGASRIELHFSHADVLDGNLYEALIENSWESQKERGGAPNCPGGNNSVIKVDIESAELAGKLGGDYIGYFLASIREGNNEASADRSFAVTITIGGVPQVKISHIDPIDFGAHSGLGDLITNESFCIYSATANGAYRLSISSSGQDASGHYLEELSGADRIPLSILYADSGSGAGTTVITNNYVHGNGDSVNSDCSGTDNTTLTLRLAEADLQAAPTGQYSGLLIILVEPE
jgi:spore coat protein U-like protein